MNRRSLVGFLLLNIIVTFLVAFLIIGLTGYLRPSAPTAVSTPLIVIVTATPDPLRTPEVVYVMVTPTPTRSGAIVIQPTPGPGTPALIQPTSAGDAPPLPETLLPANLSGTNAPPPTDASGCPTEILKSGENPSIIAQRYGISLADLLTANDLTEDTARRLQIGAKLIIPVNGCGLPTPTPTTEPSPTRGPETPTSTPPPTSTIAPTLSLAQSKIEIVQIIGAGDITTEGIELENNSGATIELKGWKLSDTRGNVYTFPELTMFEGRRVILFTRAGGDTPLTLFWGRSSALWGEPGQKITLTDSTDTIQLEYNVGGAGFVPTATPLP